MYAKDEFHVTAIASDISNAVETHGIRGQLVQRFTVALESVHKSAPNQTVIPSASGRASISVESAGQVICLNAIINGFNPAHAQLHSGEIKSSGTLVMDLSPTKVGAGRYLGCRSIEGLGIDIQTVMGFLADGEGYYLEFSLSELQGDFRASLRGRLSTSSLEDATSQFG